MKIATDADISEDLEDDEEEVGEIIETTINPQRFTEFVYEPFFPSLRLEFKWLPSSLLPPLPRHWV